MLLDLSQVYLSQGLIYFKKRRINSSLLYLQRSLLFNNSNFEAMNLIGLCFYIKGSFQEAKNFWNKSLLTNDVMGNPAKYYLDSLEKSDFKSFSSSYNNALKSAQDGNFKLAYSILSNKVFDQCDIVPVINMKGLCLFALGKQRTAVSLWKQSLDLNIEDTDAINYIANSFDEKIKENILYNLFRRILGKN